MNKRGDSYVAWIVIAFIVIVLVICGIIFIGPIYSVWQQGLEGQAELAKADYSKKVAVQDSY